MIITFVIIFIGRLRKTRLRKMREEGEKMEHQWQLVGRN